MKDIASFKAAIVAQSPRFTVVADPEKSPIPVECSLDELLRECLHRLKLNLTFHPPVVSMTANSFSGVQLMFTDPPAPPGMPNNPKTRLIAQIWTDTAEPNARTDQNAIAYAIQGIVVAEFVAFMKAEKEAADKAAPGRSEKVVPFPAKT